MSPKKSPKTQHPLPVTVDFETWKARLAPYLRSPATRAGQALLRWLETKAAYLTSVGNTDGAQRDSLLEELYQMTRPRFFSDAERKKHVSVTKNLTTLLPEIEAAIGALNACSRVVPLYGIASRTLSLSKLSRNLEEAALYGRRALIFLDRRNQRSEDALSHCMWFLAELRSYKIPEPKAVALGRVIMMAHGFSENDLARFTVSSQKDGTPRKARRKMFLDDIKVVDSVFELRRAHGDKYLQKESIVLMEQKTGN